MYISPIVHELWDGNKAVRLYLVPIPWPIKKSRYPPNKVHLVLVHLHLHRRLWFFEVSLLWNFYKIITQIVLIYNLIPKLEH